MREISEKSIREKRLPYVKKMKKSPKKRFTHTFYFHVGKKNTAFYPPTNRDLYLVGRVYGPAGGRILGVKF